MFGILEVLDLIFGVKEERKGGRGGGDVEEKENEKKEGRGLREKEE